MKKAAIAILTLLALASTPAQAGSSFDKANCVGWYTSNYGPDAPGGIFYVLSVAGGWFLGAFYASDNCGN